VEAKAVGTRLRAGHLREVAQFCQAQVAQFWQALKEQAIGVVIFRLRNTRTPNVIERLAVVLESAGPALQRGAIVTVEDTRYRIRDLPI
jgi:hypothetical protein